MVSGNCPQRIKRLATPLFVWALSQSASPSLSLALNTTTGACALSTISSISRLAAVCDHQFAWAEIAMPMFEVGGVGTVEDRWMSSTYTVPEPAPCTPTVKEVTLLRLALVAAKTMFHLCQPAIPMSVAGPS